MDVDGAAAGVVEGRPCAAAFAPVVAPAAGVEEILAVGAGGGTPTIPFG